MKTIVLLGGMFFLITGIKATNAIIIAEIEATRSAIDGSWKNIPMLMTASSHKGKKIDAKESIGYL